MAKLGTVDWIRRSHGKLGLRGKLAFIAQGVRAKAATKERLRNNIKFRHMEVDDILPPDSAIAQTAMQMCEADSEPFLFLHSMRAYFWARLLDDGQKSFDDEAVFVALMLHDMGLTDRHRLVGSKEQCFTIVGARMAEDLALSHGWTEKRATLAANAITLHLNVIVHPSNGREAELVRTGSGADVAGLGMDVLHRDQITSVCRRYPRQGFKTHVKEALSIEAEQRPCCRVAFMNKALGFESLITDTAVFDE